MTMSSTVDIIEVIEGKYYLDFLSLSSVISSAKECQSIAVISLIGPRNSGKTFLLNCFLNYFESKDRDKWPENNVLDQWKGFTNKHKNSNPVIQMYSKPMIISNENEKIGVFLMDTNRVFTDLMDISYNKIIEDMIGLLSFTSSTLIFIKQISFTSATLAKFEECLSKVIELNPNLKPNTELIFYINGWNPNSNYNFGKKGGHKYLENQINGLEINKFFSNIECFLMPENGPQIINSELNFSQLNNQFNLELSKLLKQKLFDLDEIQIKLNPNTDKPMNAQELIDSFQSYITKLNSKPVTNYSCLSLNISTINSSPKLSPIDKNEKSKHERESDKAYIYCNSDELHNLDESTYQTCIDDNHRQNNISNSTLNTKTSTLMNMDYEECEETNKKNYSTDNRLNTKTNIEGKSRLEENLESKHEKLMEFTDCALDNGKQVVNLVNEGLVPTVFGNSQTVMQLSATYPCSTFHTESDDTLMDTDQRESTECQTELNDSCMSGDCTDSSVEITFVDGTKIQTHIENDDNNSQCNQNVGNVVNATETENKNQSVSIDVIHEFQETLLEIYKNEMMTALSDREINLSKFVEFDKRFKNNCMSNFGSNFNGIDSYNEHKKSLLCRVREFGDKLLDEVLNNIKMDSWLEYEKLMKNNIKQTNNSNIDIMKMHYSKRDIVMNQFEMKVDLINNDLKHKLKSELSDGLNERRVKFEKAVKLITNFRKELIKLFENLRFIPNTILNQKYEISINSINVLDEPQDKDMKDHILNKINYMFESFAKRTEEINEYEKSIPLKVVDHVFKLFSETFNSKLYSNFYNINTVKEMSGRLLVFALKTMTEKCDFKEYQNDLNLKCESDLKCRVETYLRSTCDEYKKNLIEVKSVINNARDQAIQTYCSIMNEKLSDKSHYNCNEFEAINSQASDEAIKLNEKLFQNTRNSGFSFSFLLNEKSVLIEMIKCEKEKFKIKNNKNGPKVTSLAIHLGRHSLSAINFDNEFNVITDKCGSPSRPNCIAFSDESILFGSEAKNYLDTHFGTESEVNKIDFDLKQLLGKNRGSISRDEQNAYPFEFSDNLKVKINNKQMTGDLSIESLIALQVLDMKSDAEKQLENKITTVVLTVPTHYNQLQRDAMRDVAKIAGLESVEILREITAIAVRFRHNLNFHDNRFYRILILVMSDFECDAAVCEVKVNDIEYKAFSHKYFTENINKGNVINTLMSIFIKNNENNNKRCLNKLFDELLHNSHSNKYMINYIVITGYSLIMDSINEWTAEYFGFKPNLYFDPINVITEGSAIFSNMIATNNVNDLNIKELNIYTIHCSLNDNFSRNEKIKFNKNISLPSSKKSVKEFYPYQLPIEVQIYQNQENVSNYHIISVPPKYNYEYWYNIKAEILISNCGDIELSSTIHTKNNKYKTIELIKIKSQTLLSDQQIIEEQNKLKSIESKIKDKQIDNENDIKINESKNDLQKYYIAIKESIEKNTSLRGLKLKKINETLDKTLKVIKDENDLNVLINQKKSLQQMVETFKLNVN